MLQADSFDRFEVRQAAARIQTRYRHDERYEVFGSGTPDRCTMHVGRPAMSGDFAFVEFSDPGGEIGVYAFRRANGQWFVAEKVLLGYW
jgi:hypothetical protein